MAVQHKDITEANQHEPKGVSLAAVNRVYVSDGSGSGSWKTLPLVGLDSGSAVAGSFLQADGSGGVSANARLFRYEVNVGTLAAVAANTTAEQVVTATGVALLTDEVIQVIKPTNQAGLLVLNPRITANNQITLQFANITAASITPTASETYVFYVWRR